MTTLALLVGYVVLAFWALLVAFLLLYWLEDEAQRGLTWLQGRLSVTLRDAPVSRHTSPHTGKRHAHT